MIHNNKFKRSNRKIIAGVCAGIADWFNISLRKCRIFWTILTLITFLIPGILIYIVLWITMEPPDD